MPADCASRIIRNKTTASTKIIAIFLSSYCVSNTVVRDALSKLSQNTLGVGIIFLFLWIKTNKLKTETWRCKVSLPL